MQIRPRSTFDSSKTPEIGKRVVGPKVFASVDLEALSVELQSAKQRAIDNDPKMLKAKIAQLERQLSELPATPVQPVEKYILQKGELEAASYVAGHLLKLAERVTQEFAEAARPIVETFTKECERINAELSRIQSLPEWRGFFEATQRPEVIYPAAVNKPSRPMPPRPVFAARTASSTFKLGKGERATMIAISQYPIGVTRDQLSVLTGYKRSTRDSFVQRLVGAGYASILPRGFIGPTEAGIASLGSDYEPLPTGHDLRLHWVATLPDGESRVFEAVCEAYPQAISRTEIDRATGFKRSTRDSYIQRLRARRIVEVTHVGVRASEALFG